jgi:hypothetical protein
MRNQVAARALRAHQERNACLNAQNRSHEQHRDSTILAKAIHPEVSLSDIAGKV